MKITEIPSSDCLLTISYQILEKYFKKQLPIELKGIERTLKGQVS